MFVLMLMSLPVYTAFAYAYAYAYVTVSTRLYGCNNVGNFFVPAHVVLIRNLHEPGFLMLEFGPKIFLQLFSL